jgi:hypothetical protein
LKAARPRHLKAYLFIGPEFYGFGAAREAFCKFAKTVVISEPFAASGRAGAFAPVLEEVLRLSSVATPAMPRRPWPLPLHKDNHV